MLEEQPQPSDQIAEIANIERAMKYIEEYYKARDTITETLIREFIQLLSINLSVKG